MEAMIFKMISIDVSEVGSEEQLFSLIINLFEFPELYERTWSGMHEHLFYDPMVRVPKKLCVIGMCSFEEKAPIIAARFKEWAQSAKGMDIEYQELEPK